MDFIRKNYERVLMILAFFFGSALFFLLYTDVMQHRYLKKICADFVYEVSKDGVLTESDYDILVNGIMSINSSADVRLTRSSYRKEPLYEYCTEEQIKEYFSERNTAPSASLPVFEVEFPVIEPETLVLQDKTNANVLSVVSPGTYAPLPEDNVLSGAVYHSACERQKVYVGEYLCTVVLAEENGLVYYTIADAVRVVSAGEFLYELKLDGEPTGAYVEVVSHPRTIECSYGHETMITADRVEHYEFFGNYGACPFCAMIPVNIVANMADVSAPVGTKLDELGIMLSVEYQDGHAEGIDFDNPNLYTTYDAGYCGEQSVGFSFFSASAETFDCTLTGGICVTCGTVCSDRYLSDYERYPYCDLCMTNMPLFRGTVYSQKDHVTHEEILTGLINDGIYYFLREDYLELELFFNGRRRNLILLPNSVQTPYTIGERIRTDGKRE